MDWLTAEGLTELVRTRVEGSMTWIGLLTAVPLAPDGTVAGSATAVAVQRPYWLSWRPAATGMVRTPLTKV